jgi:hypothetical protein
MLTVYRLITGLLVILVAVVTVRERSLARQITGGLVLVPLLLRLLLIK